MNDLINIFEVNKVISTRSNKEDSWTTNTIINSDLKNNIIELELKQEYLNGLLSEGDSIQIKATGEGYFYIAQGTVKDIKVENHKKIVIKIDSVKRFEDKREDTRYDTRLNCIIKGTDFDNIGFSIVTDISKSGVGVLSRQNISLNSKVFIDILFEEGEVLKLKGVPIRKKGQGYNIKYGIKVEPVDESNQLMLTEILEELEEKEKNNVSVVKKIRSKSTTTSD